jgi:hypothetical protein
MGWTRERTRQWLKENKVSLGKPPIPTRDIGLGGEGFTPEFQPKVPIIEEEKASPVTPPRQQKQKDTASRPQVKAALPKAKSLLRSLTKNLRKLGHGISVPGSNVSVGEVIDGLSEAIQGARDFAAKVEKMPGYQRRTWDDIQRDIGEASKILKELSR